MLIFLSREDREIFARGLAWHFSDSLPSSSEFGSSKRRWLLVFIICSSHSISKIIHHSLINELDVDSNGVASNTFDWRCFEIFSSIWRLKPEIQALNRRVLQTQSYNIIWALKWGKLHASTIMGIINVIVAAQKLLQFSQTTNKFSFTAMRKTFNATLQNDFFVRYLQFSDFNFVRIIQM